MYEVAGGSDLSADTFGPLIKQNKNQQLRQNHSLRYTEVLNSRLKCLQLEQLCKKRNDYEKLNNKK